MDLALNEAKVAFDQGEIPVGCVIVRNSDKKVISVAHNLVQQQKNPLLHAEIIAINKACQQLNSKTLAGCDIYVTLEPCVMCASAISYARLNKLYYAASDLKQGAIESGIRFFTNDTCFHKPEIYIGFKQKESERLLESFFNQIRKNKL